MLRSLALAIALVLVAHDASANGRYPASNKLAVQPGKPTTLLLRTTFGILYSTDSGKNWDWICELATGSGGPDGSIVEDPSVALTANGSFLVGTRSGLNVSMDGCVWNPASALAGQAITDLTVDQSNAHTALAIGEASSDGSTTHTSQLFESKDDGQTWTPLGIALDPTVITLTLEVAKSDPQRIYVTSMRGTQASIFVSMNRGGGWVEHGIPLTSNETGAYIGAIDPTNADRVYVRTSGPMATRLLVSEDGGKTFLSRYNSSGSLAGFALSPDGNKVWVGGSVDPIQLAQTSDFAFKPMGDRKALCLTATDTRLYGCFLGDIAAESTDQGATFAGLVRLCSIRGPMNCTNDANAVCTIAWSKLKTDLAIPCSTNPEPSGNADAGADAGITPPPPGGGCGCTTGSGSFAWIGIVIAVALIRRRTR